MLRVLGAGDNVADHYLHTNTIYPGGNALNFAAYAGMLGAQAAYMGVFGDDFPGLHVLRTAREIGLDVSRCRIYHGENGCPKVRLENGDRVFVRSNRGGVSRERPLTLTPDDESYLNGFQLVHTSINSYIEHDLPKYAATGVPLSFDFSDLGSDEYFQAYCPYVTYAVISCSHLSEAETLCLLEKLHRWGSPNVIATRGADGAIASCGGEPVRRPADLVEARDTMGAGDAFLTAFLLSLVAWDREHPQAAPGQRRRAVETALGEGSRFAAKACLLDGAFGHGIEYRGYREP